MYSYEGLIDILTAKGFTKTGLTRDLGISSRTIAKIGKGEKISQNTLQKLQIISPATLLSCTESFPTIQSYSSCGMKKMQKYPVGSIMSCRYA